ncbi:nitric oxide reductase activation protein NorD [Thiohalomonas denitrificans]|uniref:nitric oxide reductase activation protein NorD n=1 Tax=Thiohalomonas denitrificans TaxID=415747 RepID=UPI0026E9C992|nr:VWA domain-containing protein [Thiohalomonas denitrificans]
MKPRLGIEEITARLDDLLEVEFSFRDTSEAARSIAALDRRRQDFILDLVARVASTNVEIAHRLSGHAVRVLEATDERMVEAWALHATDTYDRSGLRPGLQVIVEVDRFIKFGRARATGAVLEEAGGVLLHFVHGLSGRPLKLEEADEAYTDTETLYLPPVLSRLPDSKDNFSLYKAITAMLWAQTRFGTFRTSVMNALRSHPSPGPLLRLYHALETVRLEGCISRELSGLWREMLRIKETLGEVRPLEWVTVSERLLRRGADSGDSLALACERLGRLPVPSPFSYQGVLHLGEVAARTAERVAREKALFRVSLRDLLEEKSEEEKAEAEQQPPQRFSSLPPDASEQESPLDTELLLDSEPIAPPEHIRNLMSSIMLDLGEIPDEYLVPAGPGEYDPRLFEDEHKDPDEVWLGTYHEEGADLYNEWDYRRQHYRKNWCVVREKAVEPVDDGFAGQALQKYSGLVRHLRKTFEAVRDEDRVEKRQPDGDDIDLDALVEALADVRNGVEMNERVFTRLHRTERNIAVVFMVDMSGSTRGWINDAERESLLLLSEALDTLGDRFAIYGFSGMTRKRCEIYRVKGFEEPYGPEVQNRISGIRPQDYTRMGFAIRHLSRILSDEEAKTRILVTLSDGKPDDYSDYRGEYGIEDTRRALIEAHHQGIHSYCITIDTEGPEYLPHMYGPVGYTVVDDVRRLPYQVADIYRRLTT